MLSNVKFRATPEGVPYVVEFSNIKFAPPKSRWSRSSWTSSTTTSSATTSASRISDLPPPPPPKPFPRAKQSGGHNLLIRFGHQNSSERRRPRRLSPRELWDMKRAIADAVTAAGMTSSPVEKHDALGEAISQRQAAIKVAPRNAASGALYAGTYGQMLGAMNSAGLVATEVSDVCGATWLGAIFVPKSRGGNLQFSTLNLWA
ncbi:hypothetical protein BKA93DRAFT_928986 [Sparassis latifolia]|uniref:Uncharacterized protein n=1 Tax=Sparassis crispa TaxID=139825 RepID=A0A401GRX3_9APHY|nr:predicted protein [Sparassis crispa]GBE84953.1 predicted protein [Sparassis crispa]